MEDTLFNLYFALVMEQWRVKYGELGVDVQYKYGGKLVGERPLTGKTTELRFADDAVATRTDRDGMERAAKDLEGLVKYSGLTLSLAKTKLVVVGDGMS